ncbi:RsmE family RNA methyltransferase [Candidatus Dojkabacteria bacterium]|nr:RsmE family RNA methyltransferase [Candidatus Dojkabacteria bacterium]
MDYPRFFIAKEKIFNDKFALEDPQAVKKIRKVLRLGRKDRILLLDNSKVEYIAEIEKPTKDAIKGIILEKRELVDLDKPRFEITLAQALPKASKMDDIIRMNTELGVHAFIPFESEYSVIKLDKFNPKKLARWRKIAKSASEQSERKQIPMIQEPASFQEIIDSRLSSTFENKILLHSRKIPGSRDVRMIKKSLLNMIDQQNSVLIAVGPEGGFSENEIALAREDDWQVAWMDLPVLRTQTAGVVACGYLLI